MFFWRVSAFLNELRIARPSLALAVEDLAQALRTGDTSFANLDSTQLIPQLSVDWRLDPSTTWSAGARYYATTGTLPWSGVQVSSECHVKF